MFPIYFDKVVIISLLNSYFFLHSEILGKPNKADENSWSSSCGPVIPCCYWMIVPSMYKSKMYEIFHENIPETFQGACITCIESWTPPCSPKRSQPDSPDWKSFTP